MNKNKYLFVDGSVDPRLKIGYGAYLLLDDLSLNTDNFGIKTKKFQETSSTKLELETLLWALLELINEDNLTIYTDCQNIVSLPLRKEKLLAQNTQHLKPRTLLNHLLYERFFSIIENKKYQFVKVEGHKQKNLKNNIDRIFSSVDREARTKLRDII